MTPAVCANPLLESALTYASRFGWAVLPLHTPTEHQGCSCLRPSCESVGKHPRLVNGVHGASTDPAQIRAWWTAWPAANVGIATGPGSGLIVVDVDGLTGQQSFTERCGGSLPLTPSVRTGRGMQLYFADGGSLLGNRVRILPEVDVRGVGGYVVTPPSLHANGRVYAWLTPPETPLAPVPAWLLSTPPTPAAPADTDDPVSEGGRNDYLYRTARSLRARGLSELAVRAALDGENAARCRPPLDEGELDNLVDHALTQPDRPLVTIAGGSDAPQPPSMPADAHLPREYTWADLISRPFQPIEFVWPGWIAKRKTALIVGAGESYKSWITLYLACCWAAGWNPGLGEVEDDGQEPEPGRVLYLCGETSPVDEEQRRCQLLKAGHGFPAVLPVTFADARGVNLSEPRWRAWLFARVRDLAPQYLFMDSAMALSGIRDENANAEVRTFTRQTFDALKVENPDLTIVVIHHSPKPRTDESGRIVWMTDEQVARGAAAWRDAVDTALYARVENRDDNVFILRTSKGRSFKRPAPIVLRLETSGTEADGNQTARLTYLGPVGRTADVTPGALEKALTDAVVALDGTPSMEQGALKAHLRGKGHAEATIRRALDVLKGKATWPSGPHKDQRQAVVTESRAGRAKVLNRLPLAA